MASLRQKSNAISSQKYQYKVRSSYMDSAKHLNDSFLNLGYNYRGKILKKMTSPELWANPLQTPSFSTLEGIIDFLIEQVKYIKKTFSIAHDKNSIDIN